MNNDKQSSVRWMVEELEKFELGTSEFYSKTAIINRADRMHKEEIENGWYDGYLYEGRMPDHECVADTYYEKTYGGNK